MTRRKHTAEVSLTPWPSIRHAASHAAVRYAHGHSQSTDKLDVRNNFFFGGMAVFRNRCNGMTSAGTGGIWSVTSHENIEDFFFGRTMIEV